MRVVWYDHALGGDQAGFRSGRAGRVVFDAHGTAGTEWRVAVPPNSLHALFGHGVVEALNALALEVGPIAPGRDAVLRPSALSDASRILYEADRRTYGARFEFVAATAAVPGREPVEYRIAIDNREYQRTLARLQYLVTLSGREGHAVVMVL